MEQYRPVALIILDGWGMREMEHGNAVRLARTPNYDAWLRTREWAVLDASGEEVGLPADQMGNSEVGHLNLGSGRIVYQDLTRINRAIQDGSFRRNETLLRGIEHARQSGGKFHVLGLLGPGGVHSHSSHLYALLHFAHEHGVRPVVHVITDGRDTPPHSGIEFMADLDEVLRETGGVAATVSGRYYAMDRDRRWPRTERAYRAMVFGEGERAATPQEAIRNAYERDVTDEFIEPVVIETAEDLRITSGDTLVFFNFRADRMRQIVSAFAVPQFEGFPGADLENLHIITFTSYEEGLPVEVVFGDVEIVNPLAEVLAEEGLSQFHAAETEKYAHVTYFFNGGEETPPAGEARWLEPSPQVATYDMQPEMSAHPLTEKVLERLRTHDDAFILVNYANPDMVGHTGVLEAAIKACEAVDECAGRLVSAIVEKGGVALVTADHGNAERMFAEPGESPHTYHTTSPVALLIIGEEYFAPRPRGILADVAPTILHLLGVEQPEEMTGRSLLLHAGL